jgi:hypothetical protein
MGGVFVMVAVVLAAAGLTGWRTSLRPPGAKPTRSGVLVPGLVLGLGSLAGFAAPFVFLALGKYADALITSAAPLVSLFFGFIAYVLIWDGLFGTQPPYAKAIGEWFSRAVRQPLFPRR